MNKWEEEKNHYPDWFNKKTYKQLKYPYVLTLLAVVFYLIIFENEAIEKGYLILTPMLLSSWLIYKLADYLYPEHKDLH